jgi:hypothetical protein
LIVSGILKLKIMGLFLFGSSLNIKIDIALLRVMKYKKTCHSREDGNPEKLCTSSAYSGFQITEPR